MRKLLSLVALFVVGLLMSSMVSASLVTDAEGEAFDSFGVLFESVKVNGDDVSDLVVFEELLMAALTGNLSDIDAYTVEEGETLKIRVGLYAPEEAYTDQSGNLVKDTITDIEVEADIDGYEYSDYESLTDQTHLFDIEIGSKKYVNLEVTLPKKLEKEVYWLKLRVSSAHSFGQRIFVPLLVEPTRHGVEIADVTFSPGDTIKAGRSLLTTVLLENYGDKDEKDVKVTVAVPELGVSATEFVDVMETDNHNIDYEDVPEMFIQIPATAAAGDYEVKVTVKYDDLRETVTKSYTLHVEANEMFQAEEKTVLAVGPEVQTVAPGQMATYAVALTNAGTTSRAYMVEVVTGDWATATVSENFVVLEPGKNKVVYVSVTAAKNAAPGTHTASVTIKSGDEVVETTTFSANVAAVASTADNFSLRNGLEIALIVLVVLLVVIGLIVGFSRLKKDEEEEEKTYY